MSNIIKINNNPDHIKNIHRINRIHGQLKGVEKMIVEKRYCLEILQQTRAITSAIKSLENNILNKHIDHCVVDAMKNGQVNLIVNTTEGKQSILDSASIRRTALEEKICCTTTIQGAVAICKVIKNQLDWSVQKLQDIH